MKIKDKLIHALGGYTRAEWQTGITSSRGVRQSLVLGVERRLPIRLKCRQTIIRPEDAMDALNRENMAYRLAKAALDAHVIAFRAVERGSKALLEMEAELLTLPPDNKQ